MRTIILAGSLLSLLSCFSCTAPRPMRTSASTEASIPVPAPPPPAMPTPPPPPRGRIASIEHRYSTESACSKAAEDAYKATFNTAMPASAQLRSSPRIYSWRGTAAQADVEMRYVVQRATATEPTNTTITYWEAEKKSNNPNGHKADLDKVYDRLEKDKNCKKLRAPTDDPVLVNGKIPCRALMETTVPLDATDIYSLEAATQTTAQSTMEVSGRFGIIINPPYP